MTRPLSFYLRSRRTISLIILLLLAIATPLLLGQRQLFQKKAVVGTATLALSPNSSGGPISVARGNAFTVDVALNPSTHAIVGTDLRIRFDPTILIPTAFTTNPAASNLKTYAPLDSATGVFDASTVLASAAVSGVLEFGAVAFDWGSSSVLPPQAAPVARVATITFSVNAAAPLISTEVSIEVVSSQTTDTNLVEIVGTTPEDVLADSVATSPDARLTVQVISATGSPTPTPVPTNPPTPTPTPIVSGPQTYYVSSSSGNDSNDGKSETSPWKTLSKVNSFSFKPGDKVLFQRGGVWTGSGGLGSTALNISSSGIEGQPITFGAYGTGEKPIFRNPPLETNYTRAIMVDASYITVENVKVQDVHEAGVYIGNNVAPSNVIVRGIEATNVGQGVLVKGQNHLVTNNYIHDLHMVKNTPREVNNNDDYGAIGVILNNASNNEVSYNRIENAIAPSYDYIADGGVVEWWANSDNNYVHHNWGESSNGFFEVGGQSGNHALNNVVAYNVSLNNGGFSTLHVGGTFGVDASFRVENNTIVETQPHDPMQWAMISFNGIPNVNTFLLRNNIFYLDDVQSVSPADARGWVFTHEYNLYYFLDNRTTLGFSLGLGEKIADPLFVNAINKDFHLQPNSPAIDAGLDLQYLLDFDNNRVPQGSAPDIGVYEYQGQLVPAATPTPTPTPTPTVTPPSAWMFMITFQGIPPSTGFNLAEKSVRVRLVNTTTGETIGPTTASVTPNSMGVYAGTFSVVAPGTYAVSVKEPTHLQRTWTNVAITSTTPSDLTGKINMAGDVANTGIDENVINIIDVARFLSVYTELSHPVTPTDPLAMYDVNADNVFDIIDIALVLANYTTLNVPGE